jgi:hypothetical protein
MQLLQGIYLIFLCSFSLLAQRKRTKRKGSRSLVPLAVEYPAFLETTGSLETRFTQTCQTPISVVSLVLGGVKWRLKTFYYFKHYKDPFMVIS